MGVAKSKPAREAPVRYVARVIPRNMTLEQQFKKPEHTARGINTNTEDVSTVPVFYTETEQDENRTPVTDHVAPRWYLNTFMELTDSARQERTIISGNLPLAWERDKYEPYALVQNRIDDEDMSWILSPQNKKMPIEQLQEHTKLERTALQDILDTVELPRPQYRNYKGKITKSLTNDNEFMSARKEQISRSKEADVLRSIGYTPEELQKEDQYRTNRNRGVKTLDELGVSIKSKERFDRARQASEMDQLLEDRRIQQIEQGTGVFLEDEMLKKPEEGNLLLKSSPARARSYVDHSKDFIYNTGHDLTGKEQRHLTKLHWWLDQSSRVSRAKDIIYGVKQHNDAHAANEEQHKKMVLQAAEHNLRNSRRTGAKKFYDPRQDLDPMMNAAKMHGINQLPSSVEVHEEDAPDNPVNKFPHTAEHPKYTAETSMYDLPEAKALLAHHLERKDNKIETDINKWMEMRDAKYDANMEDACLRQELEARILGKPWDADTFPRWLREKKKQKEQIAVHQAQKEEADAKLSATMAMRASKAREEAAKQTPPQATQEPENASVVPTATTSGSSKDSS